MWFLCEKQTEVTRMKHQETVNNQAVGISDQSGNKRGDENEWILDIAELTGFASGLNYGV